jgi:hypothetical protein
VLIIFVSIKLAVDKPVVLEYYDAFENQTIPETIREKERDMGKMLRIAAGAMIAMVLAVSVFGCSKQASGPKDEDAIKAITSTIESSAKDATLKSPVAIVEKGKQTPAGEWQVKVEYTIGLKDGSSKKETKTYNLSSSINDMGVPVWMATEAK